jgi:type IV pilus assembly protein PilA
MRKQKGFSLIELLIVVAIILIIAAIAIPNLMRARMSANESAAAGSLRTINTAEVSYNAAYQTFATLAQLGGTVAVCGGGPSAANGCFIDNVLAQNGVPAGAGKDGYSYTDAAAPTATTYATQAIPVTLNTSGTRSFCSDQTGVIYALAGGACTPATGQPLQ